LEYGTQLAGGEIVLFDRSW